MLRGIINVDEALHWLLHAGRRIMRRLRCSPLLLRHSAPFIQHVFITKELEDEMKLSRSGSRSDLADLNKKVDSVGEL